MGRRHSRARRRHPAGSDADGGLALTPAPAALRAPTILLVDDDPDILAMLCATLARGMPDALVRTATDAEGAFATLAAERIDILVSDQRMPGMLGVDLLVRARALAPATSRMMMTAHTEHHLLERNVNEARIRHFFAKPFRPAEFLNVLRRVTQEREQESTRAQSMARALRQARPA